MKAKWRVSVSIGMICTCRQPLRRELPIFYGFGEDVSDEKFDELLAAFNALDHKYPKPLQTDTLRFHEKMKHTGLPLWILTSHLTDNAIAEVKVAGLAVDDFEFIEGSDVSPAIKPNPQAFDNVLEKLDKDNIYPNQAVYLGDTLGDFESSTGAGLQFIGVTSGRTTEAEFQKAGATVRGSLLAAARLIIPRSTSYDL